MFWYDNIIVLKLLMWILCRIFRLVAQMLGQSYCNNSLYISISKALLVKLGSGECHRRPYWLVNICSGNGFVQIGNNTLSGPGLCHTMMILGYNILKYGPFLWNIHERHPIGRPQKISDMSYLCIGCAATTAIKRFNCSQFDSGGDMLNFSHNIKAASIQHNVGFNRIYRE